MNRDAKALDSRAQGKRLLLNTDKIEAALCIALSAAASIGVLAWIFH